MSEAAQGARLVRMAVLLIILFAVSWYALPRTTSPVAVTYEIDLERAAEGQVTICLMLSGDLPGTLDLAFPPGVFGDERNAVTPKVTSVHSVGKDGALGPSLPLALHEDGWRILRNRGDKIGFVYRLDLSRVGGLEEDIRKHITAPAEGGFRAAGFEIFLQPVGVPLGEITITFFNCADRALVVPWPAHEVATRAGTLFFYPRDRRDLNNALIASGDWRISERTIDGVRLVVAITDRWLFPDGDLVSLLVRIARTEIAFFGSAPEEQITCLLAANPVEATEKFDLYGVHTGSSVLLLLDSLTTYADLNESAASVLAHEMFHGWLGEAIRQQDLTTLWFTEGVTTLYAARMLIEAGIWSEAYGQQLLASRLNRDYYNSPHLGSLPVADAAMDIAGDSVTVRYAYAGGMAACTGLETWLRAGGGGNEPLDAVLRHLYTNESGRVLSRESIEAAIMTVTGLDCSAWLDRYVYGPEALPSTDALF